MTIIIEGSLAPSWLWVLVLIDFVFLFLQPSMLGSSIFLGDFGGVPVWALTTLFTYSIISQFLSPPVLLCSIQVGGLI